MKRTKMIKFLEELSELLGKYGVTIETSEELSEFGDEIKIILDLPYYYYEKTVTDNFIDHDSLQELIKGIKGDE